MIKRLIFVLPVCIKLFRIMKNPACFLELDPDSKAAAAGIINADNFLQQKITNNFTINPKDFPLACTNKFNLNHIFNQHLELDDQDYDLLTSIIFLKKDRSFHNDAYRAAIEPIYKNQLMRFSGLCKQKNIKVLLLSYPNFLREYVFDGLKNRNTDFIDLRPQFAAIVNEQNRNEYESLDGHCTAKGYKLIADIISEHIIKITAPLKLILLKHSIILRIIIKSLYGAVAQLGEHHVRNVGVVSSNLICSTILKRLF